MDWFVLAIPDLILSVGSFFAGVGATVIWYKLRGKDVVVTPPNKHPGELDGQKDH